MYNLHFSKIFYTFFDFLLKKSAIYDIINMSLLHGGNVMREFEKYWSEYVILGCPRHPLFFFLKFLLKKGKCPTVYAGKFPFAARIPGTAKLCVSPNITRNEIAADVLLRHAECYGSKKAVLIYTSDFEKFIQSYRGRLEKYFLILNSEEIYEA